MLDFPLNKISPNVLKSNKIGLPELSVVPSFPKLTNDDKLDYGKKMELLNEN